MTTTIINESNSSITVPSGGLGVIETYQINGSNDQIALGVDDTLTATGSALAVSQTGSNPAHVGLPYSGDVVTIGGNGQTATDANDDVATFQSGATVNELANSRVDVTGNYITANLTTANTLGLFGAGGNAAYVAANGDSVWIGGNGQSPTSGDLYDYVTYTATPVADPLSVYNTTCYNNIYEVVNSALDVTGSNVNATLEGNDSITIIGSYDAVSNNSGTAATITIGGNGSAANFAHGDDYDFVNSLAGTVNLLDNSHVIVGAPTVNMGANDTLDINGDGVAVHAQATTGSDTILNFGSGDTLTLSNPFANVAALLAATTYSGGTTIALDATGDTMTLTGVTQAQFTALANAGAVQFGNQYTNTFYQSNSTIAVGSNVNDFVSGSSDQISVAASSTLTATGSALAVTATGASDVIALGGDGQSASNANEDIATFTQGGELDEATNSRVDAIGSGVNAYMTDNDTLGLYGSGDTVHGLGANMQLWIGQNGQSAAGSNIDAVSFVSGGVINAMDNSNINIFGSQSTTVNLGAKDTINATVGAAAITFAATGAGDVVNIDDTGLTAATQDILSFANGGVVNMTGASSLDLGSRAVVSGNGVTVALGAGDILNLAGAAGTVNAAAGTQVSIGGDGQAASNANEDFVTFAQGGALNEIANSRADVSGSGVTATIAGSDTLGLYGSAETVSANGAGDQVWIGQNGQSASGAAVDAVNFTSGGAIFELPGSNVSVSGSGVYATLSADDTITVTGGGDYVAMNGGGDWASMTGQGEAASASTAGAGDYFFLDGANDWATMYGANDAATATGANVSVTLGGSGDWAGLTGQGDAMTATGSDAYATLGGAAEWATLNGTGDAGVATGGQDYVVLGSNNEWVALQGAGDAVTGSGSGDYVEFGGSGGTANLTGGSENYAFDASFGNVAISGFSATDKMVFGASDFANWQALLGHMTQSGGDTIISLDAKDAVTLKGVAESSLVAANFHFV